MVLVFGLATAVFVSDQLTKAWALASLDATHPVVVIPDLLHLALVMNPGVAFGIFASIQLLAPDVDDTHTSLPCTRSA